MKLLQFIATYTSDSSFRQAFLASTPEGRVAIMHQRGLSAEAIGVALREDHAAAAELIANEVLSFDFQANEPMASAVAQNTPGATASAGATASDSGGDKGTPPVALTTHDEEDETGGKVMWPGPQALAIEGVSPQRGAAGTALTVVVRGWHVAAGATVQFQSGTKEVTATVLATHTDASTGQSWLKVSVTLPIAATWDIEVANELGPFQQNKGCGLNLFTST